MAGADESVEYLLKKHKIKGSNAQKVMTVLKNEGVEDMDTCEELLELEGDDWASILNNPHNTVMHKMLVRRKLINALNSLREANGKQPIDFGALVTTFASTTTTTHAVQSKPSKRAKDETKTRYEQQNEGKKTEEEGLHFVKVVITASDKHYEDAHDVEDAEGVTVGVRSYDTLKDRVSAQVQSAAKDGNESEYVTTDFALTSYNLEQMKEIALNNGNDLITALKSYFGHDYSAADAVHWDPMPVVVRVDASSEYSRPRYLRLLKVKPGSVTVSWDACQHFQAGVEMEYVVWDSVKQKQVAKTKGVDQTKAEIEGCKAGQELNLSVYAVDMQTKDREEECNE